MKDHKHESSTEQPEPTMEPLMPATPPPPGSGVIARLAPYGNLILLGVLAAGVIGLLIWNIVLRNSAKTDKARLQATYQSRLTQVVEQKNTDMLRLATVPLAWALRKEMIRDDWAGVDDYLTRFIKEKNVRQIAVAKADGTIAVSTDKKLEGQAFASRYPATLLQAQEVTVLTREDGSLVVGAPIMGFATRLGTVVLVYLPDKVEVGTPAK